jgi:hypothetical protein
VNSSFILQDVLFNLRTRNPVSEFLDGLKVSRVAASLQSGVVGFGYQVFSGPPSVTVPRLFNLSRINTLNLAFRCCQVSAIKNVGRGGERPELGIARGNMTRPLTKIDSNGKTYERPTEIEAAIRSAEQQDAVTASRRAAISDKSSPDFMPSECLVYLIREARRRSNEQTMNVLLSRLLARCETNLRATVPDGRLPNAAEVREDILGEFGILFAEDGSAGHLDLLDYFECRFNRAFLTLRIDMVRREIARAKPLVQVPAEDGTQDYSGDDEVLSRLSEEFRQDPTQLPKIFLKELLDAIKSLPDDERKAVVLCHILGYKEESEDILERTAATICGVSGRTIRNRLGRAAAKLSHLKSKKEA